MILEYSYRSLVLLNEPTMEDISDVTESESHQAIEKKPIERTEMNKKPTSGKEMQTESEEKVIEIFIYISSHYSLYHDINV